jgi:hypothetical protein
MFYYQTVVGRETCCVWQRRQQTACVARVAADRDCSSTERAERDGASQGHVQSLPWPRRTANRKAAGRGREAEMMETRGPGEWLGTAESSLWTYGARLCAATAVAVLGTGRNRRHTGPSGPLPLTGLPASFRVSSISPRTRRFSCSRLLYYTILHCLCDF